MTGGFHVQVFQVAGASVNWRLLSGNNRECGRGNTPHPDVETCLLEIARLQERVGTLEHRSRRSDAHRWRWDLLEPDRTVVAVSPTFDRMIRCEQAVQQFLTFFAGAPVRAGVVSSEQRRRRGAA